MRRKEKGERRKEEGIWLFTPHSSLLTPHLELRESDTSASTKLNFNSESLISLIIILIKPVDKSVDKLWISCG
jgi:hypothetical protein